MKNIINKVFITTSLLLSSSVATIADDTDIMTMNPPTNSNVLFVMDMSGSMQAELPSDAIAANYLDSRAGVLHTALKAVLKSPKLKDINVGIASFSGDVNESGVDQFAHGVSYPVSPLDGVAAPILNANPLFTHKSTIYNGETVTSYFPLAGSKKTWEYIGDVIPTTWKPHGGTPIVDSLYEAALYFRGETVDWGKKAASHVRSAHPSAYTGLLYNKTEWVPTPTPEECDGTTGIACNGTEIRPCPINPLTVTCHSSQPSCVPNAISNGYSCGPATPVGSGFDWCAKDTCLLNPSCNVADITIDYPICSDATIADCYNNNPDYTPGSCKVKTAPATPPTSTGCGLEGLDPCPGNGNTYIECEEEVYKCPYSGTDTVCTKNEEVCTHTVIKNVKKLVLKGSATYKSPIKDECSNNSIVLLSDGAPTLNYSADKVSGLIGSNYAKGCKTGSDKGRCGNELLSFLSSEDNSTIVKGDQFITTHTIGLALQNIPAANYLKSLAKSGKGQFVNATTPASLATALTNAMTSTKPKAHSFTSATYTTTASSLSTGEFVYLPVFDRSFGPLWTGNLKKYKRSLTDGRLIDADQKDATDLLGTLKHTARDFWSVTASISSVKSGGVANMIDPATRKAFTDNGANGLSANLITLNNSIPNGKFGPAVNTAYKKKLVDFILGEKADGTPRHHMGDIIHSKPIHLSYGAKKVLFVGTNEGYLHAFDETSGKELFAFMPSDLLKNIDTQYRNDAADTHVYGVDGEITLHHDDANHNMIVDGGETALLYFGLRRGGKSYYALDVSNRLSPDLKWKISNTGGFNKLGYTWSQPVVDKMIIHPSKVPTTVLVFGGGYIDDNGIDGPIETDGATTTGSGVYIVSAKDGSLIWKTSPATIKYAVPSRVRASDINGDGLLDRLYFGDTGGSVWRVDLKTKIAQTKVIHFADLSGTTKRKFFAEPDIAIFKKGGGHVISVSIGSGERPKPLDQTNDDHFFVIFDKNAISTPVTSKAILEKDLIDASSGPAVGALSAGGWHKKLTTLTGEKILSSAITYDGVVLFNSFGVTSVVPTACGSSNVNRSRFYALDLFTGDSVVDLDGDGTVDSSTEIGPADSIPSRPQITSNPPSKSGGGKCVQGNCNPDINYTPSTGKGINARIANPLRRVYWIDEE